MAAKCNKFLPNIFNKSKCQHCFAAKEAHSAEALENNKATRKVSKCGYLFVSPGFDFSNPLDRTKRWQRRFFVLYDDAELTYSVDENPDTVPQGSLDMNKCTDATDAEKTTTHPNSLAVVTPERTLYIKGNSKEEIQWWQDILTEFPKALKAIKPRRKPPYLASSNKENLQPDSIEGGLGVDLKADPRPRGSLDAPSYSTFRGVRSLKHKYDTNHGEGLRKSSSLHDLTSTDGSGLDAASLESSRFLSQSGDRLDILDRDPIFSAPKKPSSLPSSTYRGSWTRTTQSRSSSKPQVSSSASHQPQALSASHFNSSSSISSTSSISASSAAGLLASARRGSFDDRPISKPVSERSGRMSRERSSSLKDFPVNFSLARDGGDNDNDNDTRKRSMSTDDPEKDRQVMAGELKDLVYMKKGWLIKQAATDKVESLKDRLEHTQAEFDKIQKDNMDLKTRLHKESSQSMDSGFGGGNRWSQSSNQPEAMLKRQLKETRDTVQRQRLDIESLKSKLDMSVSKLTGTEKALSEALKNYKQEKDKFLRLSTEWNRRIRGLESQLKENQHKTDRSRENLQAKERECRRLEADMKGNLQRTREQEREILKLKAVEHEYNQLKEKLDDKDHDLSSMRSELKEKDQQCKKIKDDYERQLQELDQECSHERDDLEQHIEQLKSELYNVHDRQNTMTDNMTLNMADSLREKDDIIAQLEEKTIETDKKLIDMSEELQAEMDENSDLVHTIEILQEDKIKLVSSMDQLEGQLVAVKAKVSDLETENFSLRKQLEQLRKENLALHQKLTSGKQGVSTEPSDGGEEKEALKKTIETMDKQIQELQSRLTQAVPRGPNLIPGIESTSISSMSSSTGLSDSSQDLLHTVLVADSNLKEVNDMLLRLRKEFDAYVNQLDTESRSDAIHLADLVEDIGHRCQDLQGTLRDPHQSGLTPLEAGYKHKITVDITSDRKQIMEEYKGLKVKFDVVVAELQTVRKEIRLDAVPSVSKVVSTEESHLKEKMAIMEGAYKQQIVELIGRVDNLSDKIVNVHTGSELSQQPTPFSNNSAELLTEIDGQLSGLGERLNLLEQQAESNNETADVSISKDNMSTDEALASLVDIQSHLADADRKIQALADSVPSWVVKPSTQVQQYKARIGSLSASLQQAAAYESFAAVPRGETSAEESAVAADGVRACLLEVKGKVKEIGELLDSLEDDDEDSDSEDEESEQTVSDIREKLGCLAEFVEQNCSLTNSDWALLQLLNKQKADIDTKKDCPDAESLTLEEKSKLYSERLSQEAVILTELAHILDEKEQLVPEDTVCREMDALNSLVLHLHQQVDAESKTMHFSNPQTNLLASYADLMAEKILVNGELCLSSFDQRSQATKGSTESNSPVQPVLLAAEVLIRSQIDAYIGENLDRSADEMFSLPTHLTTRSLLQSELTFALQQLKACIAQRPEVLDPGPINHAFIFDRMQNRQKEVMEFVDCYERQLAHSLAVIIWKESEEMTIVDIPESVLDTMCSDLSTIMEKHIQRYKERCRNALNTHSAHRFDMIVNQLRSVRESVMIQIKSNYEAYSKDQDSIRDSSLDVPVQSLDNTINNFGEILSLKGIVQGNSHFLAELMKMGTSVLSDLDLEEDSSNEHSFLSEKGLNNFIHSLCEALRAEAVCKETQAKELTDCNSENTLSLPTSTLPISSLALVSSRLLPSPQSRASIMSREAVFSAQMTFSMFKMKLLHDRDMSQVKARRPLRSKHQEDKEESRDSDDTLDYQTDFQALLMPLEEVLESKYMDEAEVLQVVLNQVSEMKSSLAKSAASCPQVDEQLTQLEQKLQHELEVAQQRHVTHLEVFKQETARLEKLMEDQQQDHDYYEERCGQLEEELTTMQVHHEDEKERMKQDILTAVHAIRNNDEQSETQLIEKVSKLSKELNMQKLNFRKILGGIKKELTNKDKTALSQTIDGHMTAISNSSTEDEEEDDQPPLPDEPPPAAPNGTVTSLEEHLLEPKEQSSKSLDFSHHEQEVEQLKKEKEEALAEEMRNTKAALDAMRKAYEEELGMEKDRYREALVTMYTEEYVNEIRLRHQEETERLQEELHKLDLHYSSKCEDYKLLEGRKTQIKQDFESHISQLISSNDHLEELLDRDIVQLKDFIRNRPSVGSLTTGSATMEEELYETKIEARLKDAELQKLRSQVKNIDNSLQRTVEEQRQTMTQYLQSVRTSSENKKMYETEIQQLTEKLQKSLGTQGLKANIKRKLEQGAAFKAPSFHQRARSPSPLENSPSPRKDSDHSSRDSHRRRHIQPKDLRRSKSSPSLPYVFDSKGAVIKPANVKLSRRSRSPKS